MTDLLEMETTPDMVNSINAIGQRGREYLLDRADILVNESYNICRSNYGDITGEDLASVQDQGIKQALIGFMADGQFVVCDGFRRMRKEDYLLSEGLIEPRKIPCKLDQRCESQEGRVLLALEMSSGKPLSIMEQGNGFKFLRDESGYTLEAVAKAVGKSRQHICDCLALLNDVPEEIQEMVSVGSISPTEALRVFRSEGENTTQLLEDADVIREKEGKKKITAKHVKAAKLASNTPTTVDEPLYDEDTQKSELADFLASISASEWMTVDLITLRKLAKKLAP